MKEGVYRYRSRTVINNKTEEVPADRYDRGTIHISCDESFRPVIDAEVAVYESSYPETRLVVHYKPEADCLRDFAVDSIRMVVATRGFTESERTLMIDSLGVGPQQVVVAHDAIAVIVHPQVQSSQRGPPLGKKVE